MARKELTEERIEEIRNDEQEAFIWRLYRMGYPLEGVMKTVRVSSMRVAEVVVKNVVARMKKQMEQAEDNPEKFFESGFNTATLDSMLDRLSREMKAYHGERLEDAETKVEMLEQYVAALEKDISRLTDLADGLVELDETFRKAEEERKEVFSDADDASDTGPGDCPTEEDVFQGGDIADCWSSADDDADGEEAASLDGLLLDDGWRLETPSGSDEDPGVGCGCPGCGDGDMECSCGCQEEEDKEDKRMDRKEGKKEHFFSRIFSRERLPWTIVALVVVIVALCLVGVSSHVMEIHDEPAYTVRIDRIETVDGHDVRSSVAAREYETLAAQMADAVEARKKTTETLQMLEGQINDLMFLYQRNVEDLSAIQAQIAYLDDAMGRTLQAR